MIDNWAFGWNVKFKKAGKGFCTIYPKEGYFTVLAVVGTKEKNAVEGILPDLSAALRDITGRPGQGTGRNG